MDMEKYDSALLSILQNEGKVAPFLDAILGFLYRRTDFFRIMKTEHDKLGFPPGVAKKLLVNIFSKYEMQAQTDAAKVAEMKRTKEAKENKEKELKSSQENASAAFSETDKPEKSKEKGYSQESAPQIESKDERGMEEVLKSGATAECKMDVDPQKVDGKDKGVADQNKEPAKENDTEEEKEDPELVLQRRRLQANPLTYNGAEREHYFWSQTITETDLRVKVPSLIKKGKQLRVTIAKKHIKVSHQMEDGSWSTTVDADLQWAINTEESMWTLTPGEFVHINLEKIEERWWECVFVDEPKINTRKIDCSRPMTELDDEAQAKIEEMMYNQRQKQLGLPQSHEQKTHEMLRKAWDAEGSPFKGQPFDPSKLNMDANGVINMAQQP